MTRHETLPPLVWMESDDILPEIKRRNDATGLKFYYEIKEKLENGSKLTDEDFFKLFYLGIMYGKEKR